MGGSGKGQRPFKLWPDQVQVMAMMTLMRLLIILKARQLGISWLACAFSLHLCLFHPGRVVLIISKGKIEAQEMVRRISVMYHRLPEWLRERTPSIVSDNTANLEWDNGSKVQALAATPDAGSSLTASLLILDEFAKMLFAGQIFAAAKPTIDGGGKLFVISTAKGVGNPFHELWTNTVRGVNSFVGLFLPWWSRPERDEAWYEQVMADAKDPSDVLQDYPATPEEAFVASGTPRFLWSWLQQQVPNICPPLATTDTDASQFPVELSGVPGLAIYSWPDRMRTYMIGADPSEGLPHGDYSPATVMDYDTLEEVAVLDGRFDPTLFAYYLSLLGEFYNHAYLVVGRNNHGHATVARLIELGYPNIVRYPKDKREGWPENTMTKPLMVDNTAGALKDNELTLHSQATLNELQMYQQDDKGKTGAPSGFHDDRCTTIFLLVAFKTWAKPEYAPSLMDSYRPPANGDVRGVMNGSAGHAAGVGVRAQHLSIGRFRREDMGGARNGLLQRLK